MILWLKILFILWWLLLVEWNLVLVRIMLFMSRKLFLFLLIFFGMMVL